MDDIDFRDVKLIFIFLLQPILPYVILLLRVSSKMSFPRMSNTRCLDNATSLGISLVLGEPTTIVPGDRYCPTHNCRGTASCAISNCRKSSEHPSLGERRNSSNRLSMSSREQIRETSRDAGPKCRRERNRIKRMGEDMSVGNRGQGSIKGRRFPLVTTSSLP